jgi:EAL domain-containing protein (putative c-di-GMP-specific phosphodiesterase class I)
MLGMHVLEFAMSDSPSHLHAPPLVVPAADPLSAAQAAAVAAAEAVAATAAAEVAAEAAVTAQAAVDIALEAARKAASKATAVAAKAVLAAAAAAVEVPGHLTPAERLTHVEGPATAAAQVALRVREVAAAASTAALEAAAVVADQSASDIAATAAAVSFAISHQPSAISHRSLVGEAPVDIRAAALAPADQVSLAARVQAPVLGPGQRLLADELRRGIASDQLRLHYQPIMELATGRVAGVEALVRWQHPVRGLLLPQAFIGLAEQTELIRPLGAWVLHEACRMAVAMQDRPDTPMTVAVNLSGRQLSDRGLLGTVQAALQAAGCSAGRLVFEVTETALVTDMAAAVDSLREMQVLGAGVAIDDFGTGYAPLTYLKQLAADDLKIDRSFVQGLGSDSYDTAIVASLISLAHNLNVRCVAEGVETVEQLSLLQQLGCDFAQGYLFSRPLDPASLGVWLDQHLPAGGAELPPAPAPPGVPQQSRILVMHQSGASVHTIAASLNAEGSRTGRGRRWTATTVAHALCAAPA